MIERYAVSLGQRIVRGLIRGGLSMANARRKLHVPLSAVEISRAPNVMLDTGERDEERREEPEELNEGSDGTKLQGCEERRWDEDEVTGGKTALSGTNDRKGKREGKVR